MTTLSSYPGNLYFNTLEPSERHPDLLVAGLQSALVTVHKGSGVIEILAGEPAAHNYKEGVGRAARFRYIMGIAQLEHEYILSDRINCCLRSVDYLSHETQTFAGLCGSQGTADGSLVSARFHLPRGMARDLIKPTVIYVVDYKALRKIDLSTEMVLTLPGSYLSSGYTFGITVNPADGLLVTSRHGVMQYKLNETVQWLTGSVNIGPACDECGISSARFHSPRGLRFITSTVLLVADTFNKLRLINLTTGVATAIGAGKGYQDGPYQNSQFHHPHSIAVDNSFIYIGERTGSLGDGGIRKLAYTGMCDSV